MCSIFGIETKSIPEEKLRECFDRTVSRGPDMSRLVETPRGWLGFHRLSIMGLDERGMQPFEMDGSLVVCNGELYGFRPIRETLKEKYTIIIVTHNMQQASRISDKTAFFLVGDVIEYGYTRQIFNNPKEKKTEDYITGRFG